MGHTHPLRELEGGPYLLGQPPECHPHLESSPAPATNLGYLLLISFIPTISHTHPLGILPGNGFLHLPCTCQLVHGRTTPYQAPMLVGVPGQIWPLHPPVAEGYVMVSWQGCSLVRPGSVFGFILRTSSSIGPDFGMGHRLPGGPIVRDQFCHSIFSSRVMVVARALWWASLISASWGFSQSTSPLSLWSPVSCQVSSLSCPWQLILFLSQAVFPERTLHLLSICLPVPVHMVEIWATSSVCRLGNRDHPISSLLVQGPTDQTAETSACGSNCRKLCWWPQQIICSASLLPIWGAWRNISYRIRGLCSPSTSQCGYSSRNMSTSIQHFISHIDKTLCICPLLGGKGLTSLVSIMSL